MWVDMRKTCTWDFLKAFGESRAFQSSYAVLFLVPTVARLIASIPDTLPNPAGKPIHFADFRLPFNWTMLFIAACFASVANVIYILRCRALVREFKDWPALERSGRTSGYLWPTIIIR